MKIYVADMFVRPESEMNIEAGRVARLNMYRHAARNGMVQVGVSTQEWTERKPMPHKMYSIVMHCEPSLG